jgi:TonB family protein
MRRVKLAVAVIGLLGNMPSALPTILTPQQVMQSVIYAPRPVYPESARLARTTGDGFFIMRIQIRTGRVKTVQVERSTGSQVLDSTIIDTLQRWRFKPDALPPIKRQLPHSKDAFATEDSLIRVPISFVLTRKGIITKGRHTGMPLPKAVAREAQTPRFDSAPEFRVYAADFYQRMNSMWLRLAAAHANDLVPGTAKVSFHVLPDGRVTDLRLTSNTGNAALAKVALETIRKTRLGPLPSSLLPTLPHGYLPVDDISFKTFPR